MRQTYPGVELFHVHIPKTAGTSLNSMLARAFGPDFSDHDRAALDDRANIRAAALHLELRRARPRFPNARLITVLREPESRFKSTIRHLYARRNHPNYADIGPVIAQLVDADGFFVPDEKLLAGREFRERFDNLMVRYLSLTPVEEWVDRGNLETTEEAFSLFDRVLFQENFAEGAQALLADLGYPGAEPEARNLAKSRIPLWERMPDILEPFIALDRELYATALARLGPG